MNKIDSLDQFKEIVNIGFELTFTLNGKHWLLEPNPGKNWQTQRRLLSNDTGEIVRIFNNTNDVLNYRIDGIELSKAWIKMKNLDW